MGIIRVNQIKPGMVLACDVTDRTGRVILRAGVKVTEWHLKTLKAWGVAEADIEDEKTPTTDSRDFSADPQVSASVETKLKQAFRLTDQTHPAMKELFRLSVLYQLKQ